MDNTMGASDWISKDHPQHYGVAFLPILART
jgi:hypothetical protein